MKRDKNALLSGLDGEIDKKCLEIRRRRRDRALRAAFVFSCGLFLLVPGLLVFLGVSLWGFCIPCVLFLSIGFCLLSPLIFSRKPGGPENESL